MRVEVDWDALSDELVGTFNDLCRQAHLACEGLSHSGLEKPSGCLCCRYGEDRVSVGQDLGLLHAVDERFATYGYLTNTGIKFIIAIDMEGRPASQTVAGGVQPQPVLGLRDSDLKPAWKTIHAAYTELLLNPFYTPETRTPVQTMQATGKPALITSKRFGAAMERVGRG